MAPTEAELEDGETAEGVPVEDPCEWRDIGRFARPVINVTVPITTLVGLSDTPGVMAGGAEVPAALSRMISQDPTSTWFRLVTDPLGGFVELSTNAYQPTEPICRWRLAQDPQCVWPTCSRPATVVELDHRVPYPKGATSTYNLQPLCEAHHKVEHSDGFSVVHEEDGSYTWTSRFGVVSRKPPPEYPSPSGRSRTSSTSATARTRRIPAVTACGSPQRWTCTSPASSPSTRPDLFPWTPGRRQVHREEMSALTRKGPTGSRAGAVVGTVAFLLVLVGDVPALEQLSCRRRRARAAP